MTLKPVGSFGAGELSHPHEAEFDQSGRLLIADTGNGRVAIHEIKRAQARLAAELKGLAGLEGVALMDRTCSGTSTTVPDPGSSRGRVRAK